MAFTFPSHSGKYIGNFDFEEKQYSYILYFLPLSEKHQREVIDFFGNRKLEDGSTCLDVDNTTIENYIINSQVSLFCIVHSDADPYSDADIGSGTMQIYNHLDDLADIEDAQCWISDVCRTRNYDIGKPIISPIKALFYLFEQLTISLLHKNVMYLMIEHDITDADKHKNKQIKATSKILEKIYKNYGFKKHKKIQNIGEINYKIMSKRINHTLLDFTSAIRLPSRSGCLSFRNKNKSNKTKKTKKNI
jgi:hypothetical protein